MLNPDTPTKAAATLSNVEAQAAAPDVAAALEKELETFFHTASEGVTS